MRSILTFLLFLALAGPSLAVDGVLEINQTCAVSTGCFSGDTAGFPVTITASGSYRLTSNLRRTTQLGGSQNAHFIEISADDVSVDLAGFQIRCATFLGGSCSGFGSGVFSELQINGSSVRNGSITGMAIFGVHLGVQSEVTNIRARGNANTGIRVSDGSTVSGNTVYNNQKGIDASSGSTVSGNTAYENTGIGIQVSLGSTVSGNTAMSNGRTGISAARGSLVQGNSVRGNDSFGLSLEVDTVYRTNVVTNNGVNAIVSGVNRGDNYCQGTGVASSFCP